MDWLERGQNLKKKLFFAAYQTDHSFIYLMRSFEFCSLLNFGHKLVTLLKVKKKVTLSKLYFQRCSRVTFLIWSIYETSSQIFLCRLQFSTGMTFSDPSPRIQHFSLSLNSRTHSCPFKAYNLLLCEMVLMPNIHTLFCKICNLGWW